MPTLQPTTDTATAPLEALVQHHQPDSISLTMPTHRAGSQVSQNAILYKNLLREIMDRQVSQGNTESNVQRQLQPLVELQRDHEFWQHQQQGLALYFADGQLHTFALHHSPLRMALVAEQFYLVPLVVDASDYQRFDVLSLNWDEAALWEATRDGLTPSDSKLFPVALRDVVLPPDREEQLQFRTQQGGSRRAGRDEPMFHGQGEGERVIESDRRRFLSQVGKRLAHASGRSSRPLVIVATDELLGHWVAETKHEPVHSIVTSPAQLSDSQLRDRVIEWIAAEGQASAADRSGIHERLGAALAHGQASLELDEILPAAGQGRVAELLVDPQPHISQAPGSHSEPLGPHLRINQAVLLTLQSSGEVFAARDLPNQSSVAAVFRY